MSDPVVETLILDLLQFLTERERTYEEVMDAWRTSCPKLTVWEDATDQGLVETKLSNGRHIVEPSCTGRAVLAENRKT